MEDQSSELSKAVQEEKPSTSSATLIRKISTRKPKVRIGQCRICERYMEYRPLVVHLREVHGVEGLEHMILDRDQKRCMYCPVCDMMLFSQEELVEHCRNDHDDELCVVETKTFSNIKECQNWKKSVERTHCTTWRINWRLKASGHETVDYRCSRVFSKKVKRNKKYTQYSSRFKVACCTSFLKEFILYDGTVVANYCLRHVSHDVPVLTVHMPEDAVDRKAKSVAPQLLAYALKDQISKKYVGAVRDAECPLCHSKMSNNEDLANHCYKDHEEKDCRVQTTVLLNEAAFKSWQARIEEEVGTSWVAICRTRSATYVATYYRCSSAGSYRIRSAVSQSNVAARYCTSFLEKYTANDGSILVKFCTKHIGHEVDVASLPLSKGDKNVILHHLQQGHTTWDTVIKIRQEFTNPSTRLFWISEQDVARVQQSADPQISTGAHRFNSVPAAQLLEESSMFVDDCDNCSTSSGQDNVKDILPIDSMDSGDAAPDDVAGPKALEIPVSAESLIGCSMCVQLKERVSELEATVELLRRKLMEREDSQLFNGQMKKEQS